MTNLSAKIILLFFSFIVLGCASDDDSFPMREPYHASILIVNQTEFDVTVDYISDVDEADWAWEADEYEYESTVVGAHGSERVTILVTDYDCYDILTFSSDGYEADITGIWREFGTIVVDVNDDHEFVFDFEI